MLAILSDIHANYTALDAVLADARARGATRILCLGDVIGYGGQPEECVQRMMREKATNILGNHDSYVTSGRNCERSKVVAAIIDRHRAELGPSSVAWLRASQDHLTMGNDLFLHGGPNDPLDEYLYSVGPQTFPRGVRRLFCGHTHVQMRFDFGDRTFVNPGSVGQPRDGDPRAAYATLDGTRIGLHRVAYDIGAAIQVMRDKGYEEFTYRGLRVGTQINGQIRRIERLD